jgi:hypothetical protein
MQAMAVAQIMQVAADNFQLTCERSDMAGMIGVALAVARIL